MLVITFIKYYTKKIKIDIKIDTQKKTVKTVKKTIKATVETAIKVIDKHCNTLFDSNTFDSIISNMKVMFTKENLKKKATLKILKLNSKVKQIVLKWFNKK